MVVVVACGCSCTLLLHLASTFPGGSSSANTPLAHVVVITCCNLCWWCFSFQPLAQILHLHCVVVVACGGVFFICSGIYVVYNAIIYFDCNLHCVHLQYQSHVLSMHIPSGPLHAWCIFHNVNEIVCVLYIII